MSWSKIEKLTKTRRVYPIASMYGIFTYIYHRNQPNVGIYTIHGWYGMFGLNPGPDATPVRQLGISQQSTIHWIHHRVWLYRAVKLS